MVPNMVGLPRLESAISLTYGLYQVSMVVGPALAGIIISQVGLTLAYSLDAATFVAMFFAAALLRPQPPTEVTETSRCCSRSARGCALPGARAS